MEWISLSLKVMHTSVNTTLSHGDADAAEDTTFTSGELTIHYEKDKEDQGLCIYSLTVQSMLGASRRWDDYLCLEQVTLRNAQAEPGRMGKNV